MQHEMNNNNLFTQRPNLKNRDVHVPVWINAVGIFAILPSPVCSDLYVVNVDIAAVDRVESPEWRIC